MNQADEIRRLRERLDNQISLREFGAVLDGASDDLPQINAMVTTLGALAVTLLVTGPCYVSANVTIPANILVCFEGGGAFTGPGIVTYTPWFPQPTRQACSASAYLTLAQTLPAGGGNVLINFDTVDYDTDAAITAGVGWKFTVPAGKGGLYSISAGINCNAVPAGQIVNLFLYKNGVEYRRLDFNFNMQSTSQFVNVRGTIDLILAAGDVIQFQANSGATAVAINNDAGNKDNYVTIHRVSDQYQISTTVNIPNGSVGTAQLGLGSVGSAQLAPSEAWHTVGNAGEPAFQNGWVNYAPGTWPSVRFYKDNLGIVHLSGLTVGGASATTIFTLPAGYRPNVPSGAVQVCMANVPSAATPAGGYRVDVYGNGNVFWNGGYTLAYPTQGTGWLSLDSIHFRGEI